MFRAGKRDGAGVVEEGSIISIFISIMFVCLPRLKLRSSPDVQWEGSKGNGLPTAAHAVTHTKALLSAILEAALWTLETTNVYFAFMD